MIRCQSCWNSFDPLLAQDMKWNTWLSLISLLDFLRTEDYIEEGTFQQAQDNLLSLKPWYPEREVEHETDNDQGIGELVGSSATHPQID